VPSIIVHFRNVCPEIKAKLKIRRKIPFIHLFRPGFPQIILSLSDNWGNYPMVMFPEISDCNIDLKK
jgi:hypothetical protein